MTRLPTGMYQPGYSEIHGVNAAVKIVCFVLLALGVAAANSLPGAVAAVTVTAAVIYLSQLELAVVFAPILRFWGLGALVLLVNTCFTPYGKAFFEWWIFAPSLSGLLYALGVLLRVVLVILLGAVLVLTTSPITLTYGMERLLSPLGRVGVPVSDIALALSAAIQFIPALYAEGETLRKAQTARGARFTTRNYFEKARSLMPLAVSVFVGAFRRADELSKSMEARGWACDCADFTPRTKGELTLTDCSALLVSAALFALEVIIL